MHIVTADDRLLSDFEKMREALDKQLLLLDSNIEAWRIMQRRIRILHGVKILALLALTIVYIIYSNERGLLVWGEFNFYLTVVLGGIVLWQLGAQPIKNHQQTVSKLEDLRYQVGILSARTADLIVEKQKTRYH